MADGTPEGVLPESPSCGLPLTVLRNPTVRDSRRGHKGTKVVGRHSGDAPVRAFYYFRAQQGNGSMGLSD